MSDKQLGFLPLRRKATALISRRRGKAAFVLSLPRDAVLLDVGCGNASASYIKQLRPDVYYVGVDVGDYHQTHDSKSLMDEYIVSTPAGFPGAVASLGTRFDAVISNHNLEHCDDQASTLKAMASVIKKGGLLYLAFPSEASTTFPSRKGTLNFRDDETHQKMPRWAQVTEVLEQSGMLIDVAKRRYRPALFFIAGAIMEPWSAWTKRIDRWGGSWAFWGFESLIWARRQ